MVYNILFNVTLGKKTSNNYYFNKGSDLRYYINNIETPIIELEDDDNVIFDINTPGYPFYISGKPVGGLNSDSFLTEPIERGKVQIKFCINHFHELYYNCSLHQYIGNKINILKK